jgi:predicted ATPase/DNA-binding CsgD family transcriptional regulator
MMERVEQQLGNYGLKQLLGRGAFADVYFGEHLYLNTPVAIKILHSQLNHSTLADFLAEARLVSHLVHPHIIRVFDFGLESNVPFLVMDYAPHGNLRQKHPLGMKVPLPLVVAYTVTLGSAIQHAHEQRMVHRDIRPENVLVGPKGEVLLCDFGLAMLASHRESLQLRERFGYLAYMAPELFHGQPVAASDQYALAVMVYEWLSGHLPFEGSAAHGFNQYVYRDPPSFWEARPDIPRAVEQVVLKGLSNEPSQRYDDVLSFARALEEASQAISSASFIGALPAIGNTATHTSELRLDTPCHNLPRPITTLIGRERELQEVREVLLRPEVRLVTLTGPGGIGKTHLAMTLGNELLETCAGDVCFVPLSTLHDPEYVIPAILHALGLPQLSDSNPVSLLKTYLSTRRLLLVLDSFEQAMSAVPLLSDLLSTCPGLKILVTSRALLHMGGEYIYAVQPLEVPDLQQIPEPESLSEVASVMLFVERTQAMRSGFQLTFENAGDIAAICAQLEGVPLAIELAAEQCNVLSPKGLLSRLKLPMQVLIGRRRDVPERHQTLFKTFGWNDSLLSSDEQILFRRLAVFAGGCSLQAVETVSTKLGGLTISVLDGVRSLVEKSMLGLSIFEEGEPRLSLLKLVRDYALERLAECGELAQARDAHAAYYLEFAEKAFARNDADRAAWIDRLEREVENLRAALEWLLEQKQGEEALRLAAALRRFWSLSEYLSEGRCFLEEALEVAEESQGHISPAVRAKALYAAGWLASRQHDLEYATPLLEESLRLYRSLGDKRGEASALSCLSAIYHDQGEKGMASSQLRTGVGLYRKFAESSSTEPLLSHKFADLTVREIEVLRLLALGLSNKLIAERLVVSPHTVNGHLHSIFRKLAVHSRSAATRYALDHQLA